MKVKLFRRLFCLILCLVSLTFFCVSVSAARWVNASGTEYRVNWTYVGFPARYQSLIESFTAGQNYWSVKNFVFTHYTGEYVDLIDTYGGLVHSLPTEQYWNSFLPTGGLSPTNTYALSIVYSNNNVWISDYYLDYLIKYAVIIYNPLEENNPIMPYSATNPSGFTSLNYRCLVAHEVGHCIGLPHPPQSSTQAVMQQGKLSFTQLQEYDHSIFNQLYGIGN